MSIYIDKALNLQVVNILLYKENKSRGYWNKQAYLHRLRWMREVFVYYMHLLSVK